MDIQAGGSELYQGAAAAEMFRLISQLPDRLTVGCLCSQLCASKYKLCQSGWISADK